MVRRRFFLGLVVAGVAGLTGAGDGPAEKAAGIGAPPAGTNAQVIAYYFHGTIRCETCLEIEKQAREAMERRFAAAMAEQRLVFMPVNYDRPENAHFVKDYKLPCSLLVLVRQRGGVDQDWKLLGQTWDLVQTPPSLDQYVEEETGRFLEAAK